MSKYVFPAIFTKEESGLFSIAFPDVKCCFTQGKNIVDGIEMAKDALCLMLYDMEERGEKIPAPSDIKSIKCGKNEFATLISCDTMDYRIFFENKSDKKTLTVPHWLNIMAERKGINFSQVLQTALKKELNITDR